MTLDLTNLKKKGNWEIKCPLPNDPLIGLE